MIYPLVAVTVAMSGYMAWLLLFRLRRDRVLAQRKLTRGKFSFRSRDRLRFLLHRSFRVAEYRPEWEDRLVSGLTAAEDKSRAQVADEAKD